MIRQIPVFATAVISAPHANCVRTSIFRHFHTLSSHSFLPCCSHSTIPLDTDPQILYIQYRVRSEKLKAIPIEAGGHAHRLPGPTSEMETDKKDAR